MNVIVMEFSLIEKLIAGIFAAAAVLCFLRLFLKNKKNSKNKVRKIQSVKVLAKNEADYADQKAFVSAGGQVNLGLSEKGKIYRIIFQEINKENKTFELEVSKTSFDKIQEGDCGMLEYKADQLIRFGDIECMTDGQPISFVGVNDQLGDH